MKKTFLLASLLSFLCLARAFAYELPANALTYGMTAPSNAAEDAPYGGSTASSEFVICRKNAETGGQATACFSDEIDRINAQINSLMNVIADAKTLPPDAKINYISNVKTDLHRIDYLCDIFAMGENGKINKSPSQSAIDSTYLCRLNRLSVLKGNIAQAINEL